MKHILATAFVAALFVTTAQANPTKPLPAKGAQTPLAVTKSQLRQVQQDNQRLRAQLVEIQRNAIKAGIQLVQAQRETARIQVQNEKLQAQIKEQNAALQAQIKTQKEKLAELQAQGNKLSESHQ